MLERFIELCEKFNGFIKAVWPYFVALATGALVSGCVSM